MSSLMPNMLWLVVLFGDKQLKTFNNFSTSAKDEKEMKKREQCEWLKRAKFNRECRRYRVSTIDGHQVILFVGQ